jgi:hypothetical protein
MRADDVKLDADLAAARESHLDRIEASVLIAATEDPKLGLQVLRVRRPTAYGERNRLELTGGDGGPLRVGVLASLPAMSDDELSAAIRALEAVVGAPVEATVAAADTAAQSTNEEDGE